MKKANNYISKGADEMMMQCQEKDTRPIDMSVFKILATANTNSSSPVLPQPKCFSSRTEKQSKLTKAGEKARVVYVGTTVEMSAVEPLWKSLGRSLKH